jgi:acyl-coenzyme A thioesterase PaaI-like protein
MKSKDQVMGDTLVPIEPAAIESFVTSLAFVREYGIRIVSVAPGAVTVELPFDERFSGPP